MSRCIVKQSLSQPVAVAPVAPVAQVSPVSVSPVSVTPVSVSVTVTAAQPVSEAPEPNFVRIQYVLFSAFNVGFGKRVVKEEAETNY
ncbi:hypothetical protein HF086_002745 [Spodoptera exigua]|uniref:Uncharacterized protein n=1 Tax=Spodoptera exigua TaxID=7107 RepID=A0A922MAG6_SPOEX|nr:hypothetical protein HF086_002745 [Spodoptera exigua]